MALTFAQLKTVLYSAADPAYLQPFFDGDYGNGRELFEALLAVLQRVDEAIERTLQALFISHWSGEAAPPAMGSSHALLTVEIRRTLRVDIPLTLGAGAVLFEEVSRDWNDNGGEDVITGRQYTLTRDLTFAPGEAGPFTAEVIATRVGYGFANPAPDTITRLVQVGSNYQNNGATVVPTPAAGRLIVRPIPDVVVPEHVGQYVQLTTGANIGAVRRVVGYEPADPLAPNGGVAVLSNVFVGRSLAVAPVGSFTPGEQVVQVDAIGPTIIAQGVVMRVAGGPPWYVVIEVTSGAFAPTAGTVGGVTGVLSGAVFTVEDVTQSGSLLPEVATASWLVLDWAKDLGVTVTNPEGAQTTPGSYPMLDAIGEERSIARSPGEDDETYRARVSTIADVVSPNAIRRIGNRIWAPLGGQVCLREVGLARFPGQLCDAPPGDASDLSKYAYDFDGKVLLRGTTPTGHLFFEGERVYQDDGTGILTYARVTKTIAAAAPGSVAPTSDPNSLEVAIDRGPGFIVGLQVIGETSGQAFVPGGVLYPSSPRPQDRFKLNLDYTEFRAFFVVGVPPSSLGEFGVPFDAPHPYNAFDAAPYLVFFDGFPLTAAVLYRNTWQAIDRARAGGVGFDLYQEPIGCI